MEELLRKLEVHTSGQDYAALASQLMAMMDKISSLEVIPVLRGCTEHLDSVAGSATSDLSEVQVFLFYGLTRLAPEEAADWIAKWRNSPNRYIQKYVIWNWDVHWSKPSSSR